MRSLNDMAEANLCRLCAVQKDSFVGIYEEEGQKLNLERKITKCLQIELLPGDPLPKVVCLDCCAKLNQCSDFIDASAQAQVALQVLFVQPKEEDLTVSDQSHRDTDQKRHILPLHKSSLSDEEAGVDCDTLEYGDEQLEGCSTRTAVSGEDQDGPSSKRKQRAPLRWTLQLKPSGEGAGGALPDSIDPSVASLQLESVRRTIRAKMEASTEGLEVVEEPPAASSGCEAQGGGSGGEAVGDSGEAPQQQGERVCPRKRRDGWEKYPWMCTDCSQELPSMQALRTHHQTVHDQPPRFICAQCSKVYTKYYGFVSHVRRHRNHMKFCCEECGKCFSNKKVLESHRATHSDARPYACAECGKSFRQQSALYVHNRSHQPDSVKNRYPCDQCDKQFTTKPNLVTHKRIHTGVRNFTCDQCGKSFIQKGNLDAHLLTHSSDKPHLCPICNKGFKTPLQLRKHQTVHTGAKPHQCDVCGRQFRERGTLREHHRIHTGAMPFTCEFCGKAFRFKGILTTHRRQHTGERPYSCLECQHHFTNWPNYNKHMKRRHGINTSHQPDPNKIALANMTNNATNASNVNNTANRALGSAVLVAQPPTASGTAMMMMHHQQPQLQPPPAAPPPQQAQEPAMEMLGLAHIGQNQHLEHPVTVVSTAESGVYSHHAEVTSNHHLHPHVGDRTNTHFYSSAPSSHMGPYVGSAAAVPASMVGFYSLPQVQVAQEMEGTNSSPLDIMALQQRGDRTRQEGPLDRGTLHQSPGEPYKSLLKKPAAAAGETSRSGSDRPRSTSLETASNKNSD